MENLEMAKPKTRTAIMATMKNLKILKMQRFIMKFYKEKSRSQPKGEGVKRLSKRKKIKKRMAKKVRPSNM